MNISTDSDRNCQSQWITDKPLGEMIQNDFQKRLFQIHRPVIVVFQDGGIALADETSGCLHMYGESGMNPCHEATSYSVAACTPPLPLIHLGESSFCRDHGLKYPCMAGAMANGISSVKMVQAMGHAGMLGIFGAAGLSIPEVEAAISQLQSDPAPFNFGVNFIHSPHEPTMEEALADLLIRTHVHLVEASAFMSLTLPLVRYRVSGIYRNAEGQIITPNRIIAKVSRMEVATRFFFPPPEKFLRSLVNSGAITESQAELAESIPMAQDVTGEADSGGHTDNRPALTLLPGLSALRDRMKATAKLTQDIRIGAAGGISTPGAAAAVFAMGAGYIVTGSVNQACVESGSSDFVRELLAKTEQADVIMAPAADMFEMGVKVQVLKRGTMFPMKALKLYDLYRTYDGLESIPAPIVQQLESSYFKASVSEIWTQTQRFFSSRDPQQVTKAERDPKHKMALLFRWYLGHASRWANSGDPDRRVDYQIWCGPAMGAYNQWVKNTPWEHHNARHCDEIALNILWGAAVLLRVRSLQNQGLQIPHELLAIPPLNRRDIETYLQCERTVS